MKRIISLSFMLILVVSAILIIDFMPTMAGSVEEIANPIEIRWSAHFPASGRLAQMWEPWAREIEEKSDGRVKFTFYYQGTLAGGAQIYQAILKGIADIGFVVNVTYKDTFPLNSISEVPQMFPNMEVAAKVMKDLRDKFPEMGEEFKNVKLLCQNYVNPRMIHHTSKPIRVPADLVGESMIAEGTIAELAKQLGSSPVSMASGDWYMSLDRGVADGIITGYSALASNKVLNLIPYHTEMNLSLISEGCMMNLNTWNKLPEDIQQIINEGLEELESFDYSVQVTRDNLEENDPTFEPEKANFVELTEEELELWYQAAQEMQEQWVEEQVAEGRPIAREIMEEAKRLVEHYSNQ